MVKIKDYLTQQGAGQIIPAIYSFDFLEDYNSHYREYDHHYLHKFGNLATDPELIEDDDQFTIVNIHNAIISAIRANKATLEKYFKVYSLEYDPISNYDKVSDITNKTGINSTKTSYGKVTETETNDSTTVTTHTPQLTTEYENGKITTTNTDDKVTTINENKVSGYNSEGLVTDSKTENTVKGTATGDRIQSTSEVAGTGTGGAVVNKIKTPENSVTATTKGKGANDAIVNKKETNAYDITVSNYGADTTTPQEDTIHEETKGNIGVTTTQQMIQSEVDLWKNISFYDYLFTLVFESVTIPIYE